MKTYKITILCNTDDNARSRGIAGVIYSPAWFNVFKYWLSVKLGGEGLNVTSTTIEELVDPLVDQGTATGDVGKVDGVC